MGSKTGRKDRKAVAGDCALPAGAYFVAVYADDHSSFEAWEAMMIYR